MAPKIQHKRSSTEDNPPTAAQLDPGELAINTHQNNATLHFEDASFAVRHIGADPAAAGTYVRQVGTAGEPGTWIAAGTPPANGDYGYWSRDDGTDTLTTSTANDNVTLGADLAIGGDFTVGAPDTSSNTADGCSIDEDGRVILQSTGGAQNALRVFNQQTETFRLRSNGDVRIQRPGGELRFTGDNDTGTTRTISIVAPTGTAAFGSNYSLTLPPNDGEEDQVLTTDGSGGLSWEDGGAGSADEIERTGTLASQNSDFRVMFGEANNDAAASNAYVVTDATRLTYNPSTDTLSCGTFNGTVTNATNATNCSRSVGAGNGLSGGGVLNQNRTLAVGQGDGISVGSSTVAVNSSVVRVNTAHVAKIGDAKGPSHTFNGKGNAGMYFGDTNEVRIATGGVRRATFSSGVFESPGIYNNTGSDSTVVVNSAGRLRRKSSTRRTKTDIEAIEESYALNVLNYSVPVWYRPRVPDPEYPQEYLDFIANTDDVDAKANVYGCLEWCQENGIEYELGDKWMNEGGNPNHSRYGFIAEDLGKVDPRLCVFDENEKDYVGVHYDEITPVLMKIAQMQRDQIKDLEERLSELEELGQRIRDVD